MKREVFDLHRVIPEHFEIHERLSNWARYVSDRGGSSPAPMFRHYRSTEIWQSVRESSITDPLDGHKMEKAVCALPEKHKAAIKWHYVDWRIPPHKVCRALAVNRNGLALLVQDGRSMLKNRL